MTDTERIDLLEKSALELRSQVYELQAKLASDEADEKQRNTPSPFSAWLNGTFWPAVKGVVPYLVTSAVTVVLVLGGLAAMGSISGCPGPKPPPAPLCPAGQHWDSATGRCVPDVPVDPLGAALAAAYAADGKPVADLRSLASVYRRGRAIVNDAAPGTLSGVITAMHTEAVKSLPNTTLVKTRAAITTELNATLGTVDQGFTPALQMKVFDQFDRVATILEGLK